jgi:RNA polymerase sigma-70 factor, ECF subfamily
MEQAIPAFTLGAKPRSNAGSVEAEGSEGRVRAEGIESEPDATDEQLMLAFAGGDSDAFGALFERYKQPLFGFFCRRVADAAQAEELTQETFVAVVRAAGRWQPSALFRTWLYAIAFKILKAFRRKAAFRATFLGIKPEEFEAAVPSTAEVQVLMRQAVRKLDPIDREVLLLREFEQLSYAEIAELTSVPLNTVRSRLFRARMALQDLLSTPHGSPHEKTFAASKEDR